MRRGPHTDGLRPRQTVVSAAEAQPPETSAPISVFHMADPELEPVPWPANQAEAELIAHLEGIPPAQRLQRLWLALGSDGVLMIRRGGRIETYDREETREIARYFAAIGMEAWAA